MGKAIIISDTSFAAAGIGRVTPIGNLPVTAIAIDGPDTVRGATDAARYTIIYTPAGTYQRTVTWSIVSGSTYAAIDSNGVLSVLPGASNASVTIQAVSTFDSTIVATKNITVTRAASSDIWDAAVDDADFGQYMAGKQKLYEGTNIVSDGSSHGTPVTQPITSLNQNFVVLIDVTLDTRTGGEPSPFNRVADNFCMARISNVWKIGGNWAPNNDLGINETRVTLYISYDRSQNTVFVKNVTEDETMTFSNVAGGGTLRPEMYIAGGASANQFAGTIHKMYIGG